MSFCGRNGSQRKYCTKTAQLLKIWLNIKISETIRALDENVKEVPGVTFSISTKIYLCMRSQNLRKESVGYHKEIESFYFCKGKLSLTKTVIPRASLFTYNSIMYYLIPCRRFAEIYL